MAGNLRSCVVCDEPIARGAGQPCLLCGAWFHFAAGAAGQRVCGVSSDRIPGLAA